MNAGQWEAFARAQGWTQRDSDPCQGDERVTVTPVLYHAEQDRVWPAGDWEGAARDLGLDETDAAE